MSLLFQNSATVARPAPLPAARPFSRQLKELCYRVLSPNAETIAERGHIGWEKACLERAAELSRDLKERYTLFIGTQREGLLVANLLANRYGASLAELQAFGHGMIWMSGQVKEIQSLKRILVILPLDPQFSEVEHKCLESILSSSTAHATSAAPGAPILPIRTVSVLSEGPHPTTNPCLIER